MVWLRKWQFWPLWLLATMGCDGLDSAREFFHPGTGHAGLFVDVTPNEHIEILLDGAVVATRSPYSSTTLTPGAHRVEVRRKGFVPLVVPVSLENREVLHLPLVLRRAGPRVPQASKTSPMSSANVRAPKSIVPPPPPPSPTIIAPPLPPGVKPLSLGLRTQPQTTVLVDGRPLALDIVRLERVWGSIHAGPLELGYRVGGRGLLELSPKGFGDWTRDGAQLTSETFLLHSGSTRLEYQPSPESPRQTLLLRRH